MEALLDEAQGMAAACRQPAVDNPGLRLGAVIGEAALAGRDKLTLLTTPRLASLGDWIEQLIAESTGKAGRGVVPVVGEPVAAAEQYGTDRCFGLVASPASESDRGVAGSRVRTRTAVHERQGAARGGRCEFVRWEVATAALGIAWVSIVRQPNVARPGRHRGVLADYRRVRIPHPMPIVAEPGLAASPYRSLARAAERRAAVRSRWNAGRGDTRHPAYLPPDLAVTALSKASGLGRDALGAGHAAGIGPR